MILLCVGMFLVSVTLRPLGYTMGGGGFEIVPDLKKNGPSQFTLGTQCLGHYTSKDIILLGVSKID